MLAGVFHSPLEGGFDVYVTDAAQVALGRAPEERYVVVLEQVGHVVGKPGHNERDLLALTDELDFATTLRSSRPGGGSHAIRTHLSERSKSGRTGGTP